MKLQFEPSEMARFGYRMARLRIADEDTRATADDIVRLCQAETVEMLTLRVPTHCFRLVQELGAQEFRLMDCLVYYETAAAGAASARTPQFDLREATSSDAGEVGQVARMCFADYFSHYHADPRLDRVRIADGYVDWAQRSCVDRAVAATVFLPLVNGRIAGFATMRRNSEAEGEGVLFGVHPAFGGLGIYGALIDRGKRWCHENGMTRMIVSTQLDNFRVQRSWANRNFRLFRSYFTFHRWFI